MRSLRHSQCPSPPALRLEWRARGRFGMRRWTFRLAPLCPMPCSDGRCIAQARAASSAHGMHQRTPVGSEDDLHFLLGNDIRPPVNRVPTRSLRAKRGGRLDVAALRYPDCQIARDTPRGRYDEQNRIAALNGILRGNGECAGRKRSLPVLACGSGCLESCSADILVRVAGFREVQNARRHARINLAFAQPACGQMPQRLTPPLPSAVRTVPSAELPLSIWAGVDIPVTDQRSVFQLPACSGFSDSRIFHRS